MTKPIPVLFVKSHIDTYTRGDGVVVQAHDNKVQAHRDKAQEHREAAKKLPESHEMHGHHIGAAKCHEEAADMHEYAKNNRCAYMDKPSQLARKKTIEANAYSKAVKEKAKEHDWRDEENWHTRTMMKFKTLSDDSLKFILKDATEAAEIAEKNGFDSKKSGQYRDEAHYASMELRKRREGK